MGRSMRISFRYGCIDAGAYRSTHVSFWSLYSVLLVVAVPPGDVDAAPPALSLLLTASPELLLVSRLTIHPCACSGRTLLQAAT